MDDEKRPIEEPQAAPATNGDGAAAREPVDPRILAIARAIGRLIARERFKAAMDARDRGDSPCGDT